MSAGLAALDDDRIDPHAHELAGEPQGRRKTEDASAALLDPADRGAARQAAGEHDMADAMLGADFDQIEELGMQGDQVDAERAPVSALVASISIASSSGDMDPEAMTPNPPALDIAATRLRSDTQVIAPPMTASSQPRTSRPRAHSRSSCAPAPLRCVSSSLWTPVPRR